MTKLNPAAGVKQLLLDGQQRVTSLYGIVRGRPPEFFEGDLGAFTSLDISRVVRSGAGSCWAAAQRGQRLLLSSWRAGACR